MCSTTVSIVVASGLDSVDTVVEISAADNPSTAAHTTLPSSYSQNNPYLSLSLSI